MYRERESRRNGFQTGWPWKAEKYCQLPWLADKKNLRITGPVE